MEPLLYPARGHGMTCVPIMWRCNSVYGFGYGWQGSSAQTLPRSGDQVSPNSQLVKGVMGRSVGCWLHLPGPVASSPLSALRGASVWWWVLTGTPVP